MRKNELLREWLTAELRDSQVGAPARKLKLHISHTQAVELLKAMELTSAFGKESFQYVMDWASEVFGIDLKNHRQTLDNMKVRKIDVAKYLHELAEAFTEFMKAKG